MSFLERALGTLDVEPAPARDAAIEALSGKALFLSMRQAIIAGDHGRVAVLRAETTRRLAARGDLDAKGDIRTDKCFDCGATFGEARELAAHNHRRGPDALEHLRSAGVTDSAAVEAVIAGDLAETPAMVRVRSWLRPTETPALALAGGVGAGKTWAAVYALGHLGGLWADAHELGHLLPADWVESLCVAAGVVVLDDLGQEHLGGNAGALSVIDEIVKRRVERGLRLLCTSNLQPEELQARYGERFWSRVAVVEVGGGDLRRR